MLLKATIEEDIDMEEVLNSFMNYEADVLLWYTDYRDIINQNYEAEECIVLEQNVATVLKACIDLYIQKVQQYRDEDLEEEMRQNPI